MLILYLGVLVTALYSVYRILAPEMAKTIPSNVIKNSESFSRIEKLESLLAEKNLNLHLLETELKTLQVKARNFDAIKALLEGEIHRLREQNRIFRSELGIPAISFNENQTT